MKVLNIILIGLVILSGSLVVLLVQSNSKLGDHDSIVAGLEERVSEMEAMQNQLVDERDNLIQSINDFEQKERRYLEIQQQLYEIAGITSAKNTLNADNADLDPNAVANQSLDTLQKNQSELKKLRAEKGRLYSKINSLKKDLNSSNADKDRIQEQINQLKAEMDKTDVMISNLEQSIINNKEIIKQQNSEMNTIFYVIGNKVQLREMGVTTKEGGVLWGLLGSTEAVRNDYKNENFTSQNLAVNDEIEISAFVDDITIHTKQHKSTYELVEISESKTILKVKNHEKFRKNKHLIIEID
ncbi:MAG: hypothetical protein B6226_05760 [Candidatus Cloacimonetes bacterium 4572_65]|nr:MAG: hypothetical protein B6226_05760 [Candidatus Cloacimonetes bacterium 4572_65]